MTNNRVYLLLILLLILLVSISGITVPIVANAAKYAQVSREILLNNDWINLTIGSDAYDQKPPLLFWIGAAFYSIFGVSFYVFKIAVLLISFLGIYSTFRLGKLLYNKETGILAAIFWTTSLGFLYFHNDIHTDTLLSTFVVFSVWQLTAYFKFKKWHQFFLGVVGIGLSMLTKGPVGLAIPVFAIGGNLLLHKKWKEIFHYRWIIAAIIVSIIILPALIGLLNQFGLEGIKFYFWTNNMGRITGSYHGSNSDPTFYIHTALYMLAPWTIFVIAGMYNETRSLFRIKKHNLHKTEIVNISAVVLYLGILSIAKTKNPHYLLGVVPFILIIVAKWSILIFDTDKSKRSTSTIKAVNKGIAFILTISALASPLYAFPESNIYYWLVLGAMLISTFYLLISKTDLKKQVLLLILSISTFLFTLNVNMLPRMLNYHTSIEATEIFNKQASDNATLNFYKKKARLWSIFLYSKAPGKYLVTTKDMNNFLPKSGAWIYTDQVGFEDLQNMNIKTTTIKKFKHKTLTTQSIKFLNPKTREENFTEMYLIRLE